MNNIRPEKTISILIGNNENILTGIIFDFVQDKIGRNLSVIYESEEIKIKKIAEKLNPEMFVLVLNNIHYFSDKPTTTKQINQMLNLISELKLLYKKPVIAMAGWPDEPEFASKVAAAGSDYFFRLPFKPKQFQKAVISCLRSKIE